MKKIKTCSCKSWRFIDAFKENEDIEYCPWCGTEFGEEEYSDCEPKRTIRSYRAENSEEFSDYDFNYFPMGVDWVAYYYQHESYEGRGYCLIHFKDDDVFVIHDCGHCSCYGPLEHYSISSKLYTHDEIEGLRGKDLNGQQIEMGSWDRSAIEGLWEAYDKARKVELKSVTSNAGSIDINEPYEDKKEGFTSFTRR